MPRPDSSAVVVVTCQPDNDEKTTYVAKIFDGMEYSLPNPYEFEELEALGDFVVDFMSLADEDYATEARAYEVMLKYASNDSGSTYFPVLRFVDLDAAD